MDVLQKISAAFESYAACALAMQMAGEKADAAAKLYTELATECKNLGLPYEHYDKIAYTFREITELNRGMGFDDIVKTCLFTAEVCR